MERDGNFFLEKFLLIRIRVYYNCFGVYNIVLVVFFVMYIESVGIWLYIVFLEVIY